MKKVGNSKKNGLTPMDELNNDKMDDIGILFFKDERNSVSSSENADDNVDTVFTERFAATPLDSLKQSLNRTVEETKKEEKAQEQKAEKTEQEERQAPKKPRKTSSLLARCMPYIYDEEGISCVEDKPDYTLESVEEIIESAEKRASEKIARMYNLSKVEVESIGTEKKAKEEEKKPKLLKQETSVKKAIKIGDEPFSAAKLFETAPIPKLSDTLFDDLTSRRTDVVGEEKVTSAYSAQGGMGSADEGHTRAIPDLTPETDSAEKYEDIISKTRPVNIEDISSTSSRKAPVNLVGAEEQFDDIKVDEFTGEKDIKRIGSSLKAACFIGKIRTVATALITALAGVFLLGPIKEEFEPLTLSVISMIIFAVSVLINSGIFTGFKGAFTKNSKIELPLALAVCLTAIYFIAGIISGNHSADITVLITASLTVYDYCVYRKAKAIFSSFKLVAARREKTAVSLISDPAVTSAMARTVISGEVLAAGQQQTDEIGDFVKHSLADKALLGKAGVFSVVSIIFAAFIGVASGFSSESILSGLLSASTVLCFGAAPTLFIADTMPFVSLSDKLFKSRAVVCSKASAEKIEQINAVVISSKDLFKDGSIKLFNMMPLSANELDETLALAAEVAKEIDSPLAPVFSKILSGENILPKADSVKYEDSLGVSGWVGDEHVLIGNRSLMLAHGVRVPALEVDKKILRKGYFPVYIAVNQRACALLVVGYTVNKTIERQLGRLMDKNVTLLVENCDPNITEQMLCDYFSFYPEQIKILDHNGVAKYKKATPHTEKASAHAFHSGGFDSFINLLLGSIKLRGISLALTVIHILAAVVCSMAFAVLSLGGAGGPVGIGLLLVGELVFAIISLTVYFAFKM